MLDSSQVRVKDNHLSGFVSVQIPNICMRCQRLLSLFHTTINTLLVDACWDRPRRRQIFLKVQDNLYFTRRQETKNKFFLDCEASQLLNSVVRWTTRGECCSSDRITSIDPLGRGALREQVEITWVTTVWRWWVLPVILKRFFTGLWSNTRVI